MATSKDFIVKNGLVVGANAYINATSSYLGSLSGVTLNYVGNGTQYGFTLKPNTSTADTYAINFLTSSSTYGSATSLASIQHLANDAGMNLAGTWKLNGAPIATTSGTANNVTGVVAIANGGTGATTASGALTNLGAQKTTLYTTANTTASTAWIKLGTLTLGQNGQHANIRIYSSQGFNAVNSQDAETHIHFKTSNGTSVDANGFAGNANYYSIGQNSSTVLAVKFVANAAGVSATAYDVYVNFAAFAGAIVPFVVETGGVFTYSSTTGSDPGAASSTVCIATNNLTLPNLTVANVGTGATILDSGSANIMQIKGQSNGSAGFIKFGNAPYAFGYDTANLVYGSRVVAFTDSSITGNAANVTGVVAVANGGTGATTASGALTNFGFKAGLAGQSYFITGDSTNAVTPSFTMVHGKIVENASELAAAQSGTVDQSAVFNTWYRFSHNSTNTYPADSTETTTWTYNTSLSRIENTTNSVTLIGVVSPDAYDNYYFKTRVMSTNNDDDFIGIVLGFVVQNGREYTLTAVRSNNASSRWMIRYNYAQSDGYTVYTGDAYITNSYTNGGTAPNLGWVSAGTGCVIEAKRTGNTISVVTSEMGSTTLVEATRVNIDLTSDARLQKFMTPSRIGYVAYSQASSSWNDVIFTSTADAIYDIVNNVKYLYDAPSQTWVSSSVSVQTDIGVGRFIFSTNNKRLYYIKNSAVVSNIVNLATSTVSAANQLTPGRTINGVLFDGTSNVTISDSTKLPLAGGTLTGGLTLATTAPVIYFDETDQSGAAGKWRMVADGAGWRLDQNTATARDFSTYVNPLSVNSGGYVVASYTNSSVQIKLNRTGTTPGSGWIGADSSNAFNVYTDVSGTPTTRVFWVDNQGVGGFMNAINVGTSGWAKLNLTTSGVTAIVRQASDQNGMNFTTNASYATGSWVEDDSTKKKFAYIQHLGNGRHEFRTAAAGTGISWATSLTVDDTAVSANVPLVSNSLAMMTSVAYGPTTVVNTLNGLWNPIAHALADAKCLYEDEEFFMGSNGVVYYNNNSSTATVVTRIADSSAPNASGYVLKIAYDGTTASPGLGGFVHSFTAAQNRIFVQRFRAKIPVGYSVVDAQNTLGTNFQTYWLTSQAGTGKWEDYVRVSHCGDGGTYSSGGHVYLSGPAGAVTWYLASASVFDVTQRSAATANGVPYTIVKRDGTGTLPNPTFSGNVRVSTTNGLAAAGTTQATGAAISTDLTVVSSVAAGAGVVLPVAVAGMKLIIINTSANTLNVYPNSGATIDALGANVAFSLGANARIEIVAVSSTQWYAMTATLAA